jgi:uncharacterized membrane protein YagU involved in acid resistance
MRNQTGWKGIFWGGTIAGVCDITYAIIANFVERGVPWDRTLQSVASGWVGRPAFSGGMPMAAVGLASHFLIAFIWTTLFYAACRVFKPLALRPLIYGPLYGALVYVLMNTVVVPLSAAPFTIPLVWAGLLVHMFLVGLPIAFAVSRSVKE